MRVLIIGGLGFIGFHLCKRLISNGFQVDIIDNLPSTQLPLSDQKILEDPNLKYIKADVCLLSENYNFNKDYEFIFHFAALLGVEMVSKNPYRVLKDNILMTFNVIEIARQQRKLKKIFFTSTSEVYAGTLRYYGMGFPTPENIPLTISPLESNRSSYMLSKIYGEGLLHFADIPYIILRPHNIYGPRMGNRHVIPQLLEKAHALVNGESLEVYSPSHTRTFCYVQDAVNYMFRLMEVDAVNIALNLGVESPEISMKELSKKIISVVGKNLQVKEMPNAEGSPERRAPKTEALIRYTGYSPQVSLEQGLQETYSWYRENKFKC